MHTTKLAASLLVLLALVLIGAPAWAETVNCTAITSLPAVITVQGVYCFTGDLSTAITTGNAIEIQTNNVVIDLNGFKLGGLAAGPGTLAYGIRAGSRQNITIKNGTIRGFFNGIFFDDAGAAKGHVVEDIRADQNTSVGMRIEGPDNIIRNNLVVATGGTTALGANADAYGIIVFGTGVRVLNNDVIDTLGTGTGSTRGIDVRGAPGALVVNNRITGADVGIDYGGSTGKFRDNITFDVTTSYIGGTNIGNNN